MTAEKKRNFGHSVYQKLLDYTKLRKENFTFVLLRYGMERLLYRLSVSPYSQRFILKGASMFLVWQGQNYRVTKNADLLGSGQHTEKSLEKIFKEICQLPVGETDGMIFHSDTVKAELIREDQQYGGIRITLVGQLHNAKIPLQVDIGFGDSVTPSPEEVTYPTILSHPAPHLRAYTAYTVVAEKFNAMVELGMANSRMKDFFDIWLMTDLFEFEGGILQKAIHDTFFRRKTAFPDRTPIAFSDEFSKDKIKKLDGFLKKSKPQSPEHDLMIVVHRISSFLMPVVDALQKKSDPPFRWPKGGPWVNP